MSQIIHTTTVSSSDQSDERAQKRSTVRLGIRLIHKICPESHLSSGAELATQQPTVTRSLRSRLSPKARKLIKQTSLIIHGSSREGNNNSNGSVKSIVEADVVDGFNRVSIMHAREMEFLLVLFFRPSLIASPLN